MKPEFAYPALIIVAALIAVPWLIVLMKKYMSFVFNYMGF